MKKLDNQKREGRGGARPGAGRPRISKITAVVTPGVLAQLVKLAERQQQTPEEYAADLLTQAVMTSVNQPTQATTPSTLHFLSELLTGPVAAVHAHQLQLIEEMKTGGRLVETGRDVWMLTAGSESRRIDSRTIFAMRQKNMLIEGESEADSGK